MERMAGRPLGAPFFCGSFPAEDDQCNSGDHKGPPRQPFPQSFLPEQEVSVQDPEQETQPFDGDHVDNVECAAVEWPGLTVLECITVAALSGNML